MELTEEDRERIEQEAFATFGSGILTYPAFIKGAEYENKYQRAQQAELRNKVIEEVMLIIAENENDDWVQVYRQKLNSLKK